MNRHQVRRAGSNVSPIHLESLPDRLKAGKLVPLTCPECETQATGILVEFSGVVDLNRYQPDLLTPRVAIDFDTATLDLYVCGYGCCPQLTCDFGHVWPAHEVDPLVLAAIPDIREAEREPVRRIRRNL